MPHVRFSWRLHSTYGALLTSQIAFYGCEKLRRLPPAGSGLNEIYRLTDQRRALTGPAASPGLTQV